MDRPKKDPALIHNKLGTKLCLNCGFPNRELDRHCMYCQTSMVEEESLISWVRQTYFILRWRWQLKQRLERVEGFPGTYLPLLKLLGYFAVGLILSVSGLYLFSTALNENSFSSGLIAALFLCYGVFTLKSIFVKK